MSVGVIGSGSWATAIAKILHENQPPVHWYVRNDRARAHLREHARNPDYLSGVRFDPARLHLCDTVDEVVRQAEIIFFVVPSAFIGEWLRDLHEDIREKFIVTSIKGIVPGEHVTASEYLKKHFQASFSRMGVVSGPCHAEEVALERLSFLTIAFKELEVSTRVASLLRTDYIRTIPSQDIYGTEYSAILKNIYAVAAGIAHGLGYGDNFQAVLACNAQNEIARFLDQSYPDVRNVNASPYLGDLLVTCYSQFSRNRTFGTMIGKGYSVRSAQMEMNMVAEGYYASEGIHAINQQHGVEMPIAQAVHRILHQGRSPRLEFQALTESLI